MCKEFSQNISLKELYFCGDQNYSALNYIFLFIGRKSATMPKHPYD